MMRPIHSPHNQEHVNYNTWVKTSRGWVMRTVEVVDVQPSSSSIVLKRTNAITTNRDDSQGRSVQVTGCKGQRKLSVCISDFLNLLRLTQAIYDIRQQQYFFDLMTLIIQDVLNKMSGTSHTQFFKILGALVDHTLENETQVPRTRALLDCTWTCLTTDSIGRIGSKSLWKRHTQNVANLRTKMDQFTYKERTEDGLPTLLDLPKECVFEIMFKLSDHRDVLRLGMTCTDLYYMTQSSTIWEKLTEYHFNEKQMATFSQDADFSEGIPWQDLYKQCYKKYGLKHVFTDQLVICSACKTLHWLMVGHNCWSLPENNEVCYMDPVSPRELTDILMCV